MSKFLLPCKLEFGAMERAFTGYSFFAHFDDSWGDCRTTRVTVSTFPGQGVLSARHDFLQVTVRFGI